LSDTDPVSLTISAAAVGAAVSVAAGLGVARAEPAGGHWVWHDFEDTCSGPAAWDLAASTANRPAWIRGTTASLFPGAEAGPQ
jgi:hypothetical protein